MKQISLNIAAYQLEYMKENFSNVSGFIRGLIDWYMETHAPVHTCPEPQPDLVVIENTTYIVRPTK